jgi:GNAT superfamily N-acetyltransferase
VSSNLVITGAGPGDIESLAALAREELPRMTSLHEPESWRTHLRFGMGQNPQDRLFAVARETEGAPPYGFCWVDAAMRVDCGIEEPWWCINALVVAASQRGHGTGSALAEIVKQRAASVGIVSLYGVSYSSSAPFWKAQGFDVGPAGGYVGTDRPVAVPEQGVVQFKWCDSGGDHMFVLSFTGGTLDAARLQLI